MKALLTNLLLLTFQLCFGQSKYEKDFNEFWNDVNSYYAYLDQQKIDWSKAKEIYLPLLTNVDTDDKFIGFMEEVLNEFHNGHISLNTNIQSSNRLVPTGQDMQVEEIDGKFYITDLRKGFGAELCGLTIGSEVVLFNGKSVGAQRDKFLPRSTENYTPEMYQYALNMLFAGTHDTKRSVTISENGVYKTFFPDTLEINVSEKLLEKEKISEKTAYLKINNSLGNNDLIEEFDKAIDEFINLQNIILDLTETPSGGNTTVARSIMGRFINTSMPYQQHEYDEKEFQTKRMWVEYVSPRKSQFKGKLFILVGHWTGSMGEGIAIGFDGMKRARVIGTKMAGLIGAIEGFVMSETQIGYQIPTERLYHINGSPRESYVPTILTKNMNETYLYIEKLK